MLPVAVTTVSAIVKATPVTAGIISTDTLVVGQQMTVYVVLESGKDVQDVSFELITTAGWTFVGGKTNWAGPLTKGQPVEFKANFIPTVSDPEPLKGRLSVTGWPDSEWKMDMSRLGGKTPEINFQETPLGIIPEEAPVLRPEWENQLPSPEPARPTEPRIPGQTQSKQGTSGLTKSTDRPVDADAHSSDFSFEVMRILL